ncbi:MAG TPA: hypothetical protein VFT74_17515, partial [Isosphaeraceae bacterium]|nr:hypothetical protein [Isosphaeraceae bacterium]
MSSSVSVSVANLPTSEPCWDESQEALETEDGEDDALAFYALEAPPARAAPPITIRPTVGP